MRHPVSGGSGVWFFLAFAAWVAVAHAQHPPYGDTWSAPGDGARSLFDGRTLDGWEYEDGRWRVDGGSIIGEILPGESLGYNTWLIWKGGEVGDFELRLQFRISGSPGANSGIQFRCQAEDVRHVSGYQADLDGGATWLGRIYDEHGRALLVERGTRVRIGADGRRTVERFADPALFETLFRERTWNDYRIIACGEHVSVEINGTLFSELIDSQAGERDVRGHLALQLHSGGETKVQFRNIFLRELEPDAHSVLFAEPAPGPAAEQDPGMLPRDGSGRELNLGFEDGTLRDWSAEGDAFRGQPLDEDGIASRWPGQTSDKHGRYFIGGYEIARDAGTGTLTSVSFPVSHPFATLRFGGGRSEATRAEVVEEGGDVLFATSGEETEQMRRIPVDLRTHQGKRIFVRLVDASSGPWGHLNFDDFRFHDVLPAELSDPRPARVRENPILAHLVENPATAGQETDGAAATVAQMWLEPGFTAEQIAGEPRLTQPIAFAFDDRGRIWVAEAHSYPQKREPGAGLDRIVILEDTDADGTFETRKVFAEGLNLVSGLEVGHGGVWVGAAPELLFLPDADGDDKPDGDPVVLLDGFGYQDTHETLNSFAWGPDGWLYGNQGVFNESSIGKPGAPAAERAKLFAGVWRYHPVRHAFEIFAAGGSNQWGLDFDDHGQLFITHCRSHYGRGATTHVIQSGHYWNQSNTNHAPFIRRDRQNYLLASAPYGHGEGGAGKRGSRRIYGGHSHVGTLLYLGDNWPREFHNHLFTLNLHGHQINHQANRRHGSGFETLHGGRDVFYCADPQFIGVDLQCGPDGAVYVIDWVDRQHCHNPNEEQWDRSNGRLYRIAYGETWKPAGVALSALPDAALIDLQQHANDWHVRHARRLLQERAASRQLAQGTADRLRALAAAEAEPRLRLRYLWALHATGGLDDTLAAALLAQPEEFVQAWTIQLAAEDGSVSEALGAAMLDLAGDSPSATVRLYLASAAPRLQDRELAWRLVEKLAQHAGDADDPNLPKMLWFALAGLLEDDAARAMSIAERSPLATLRGDAYWFAAKPGIAPEGLALLTARLAAATPEMQREVLESMAEALDGERALFDAPPAAWQAIAPGLYQSGDAQLRQMAESIGAAFGDATRADAWRAALADPGRPKPERQHAFRMLGKSASLTAASAATMLKLLDDADFRPEAIRGLRAFDDPDIATTLVGRMQGFTASERTLAIETLIARPAFASVLLDAIASGAMQRDAVTAHHARQIANLGDPSLVRRLESAWGRINSSPEAVAAEIDSLEKTYAEAPLWAFSAEAGKARFQSLCLSCHEANDEGGRIGPDLTGSGANGARYFLENILDPNAVVGADYQITLVTTTNGQTIAGTIAEETATALTLHTATDPVVVAKDQIAGKETLPQSLMPPGLLQALSTREKIELLKYLNSL